MRQMLKPAVRSAQCPADFLVWSRALARSMPRKYLRVLPTRTRPSLFGGD